MLLHVALVKTEVSEERITSIIKVARIGEQETSAVISKRKSGSAGNRTWVSGSVATNSDHRTTEAVKSISREQCLPKIFLFVGTWEIIQGFIE
jgi:hypothetical protein